MCQVPKVTLTLEGQSLSIWVRGRHSNLLLDSLPLISLRNFQEIYQCPSSPHCILTKPCSHLLSLSLYQEGEYHRCIIPTECSLTCKGCSQAARWGRALVAWQGSFIWGKGESGRKAAAPREPQKTALNRVCSGVSCDSR